MSVSVGPTEPVVCQIQYCCAHPVVLVLLQSGCAVVLDTIALTHALPHYMSPNATCCLQDFVAQHASPDIDYAAIHMWPDNWNTVGNFFAELAYCRYYSIAHRSCAALQASSAAGRMADRQSIQGIWYAYTV